jgi:hypothetical protein
MRALFVAILLSFVTFLAGCGGSDKPNPQAASSPGGQPVTQTVPAGSTATRRPSVTSPRNPSRRHAPPRPLRRNAPAKRFCDTHKCASGFERGSGPIVRCPNGVWTRAACSDGVAGGSPTGGKLIQCNDGRWVKAGASTHPCAKDGGESGQHYP